MEKELLPCPFCGGKAKIATTAISKPGAWIICIVCKASTKLMNADIAYIAKDEAVEAWNRRVPVECDSPCIASSNLTDEQIDDMIKAATSGQ